ncbi:hypothetical protein Tsubulata_005139 [Turnera subulata]|uniref:Uncharacterized protein n=1 Tax=Turnera subulata TaxID=218843 RepID=A0A9Q0FQL0_9ROSI|nr:hypothetical protein Tsubulata_005139 [Turnera subulata]
MVGYRHTDRLISSSSRRHCGAVCNRADMVLNSYSQLSDHYRTELGRYRDGSIGSLLEVKCKSLNKTFRFAAGTKAGFAVSLINRKLGSGSPLVSHIEAVKDEEEPISFGPDAVLVDYGSGWMLQTATESDYGGGRAEPVRILPPGIPNRSQSADGSPPTRVVAKPTVTIVYLAKILLAFFFIFVLGAILTLALENIPRMILFINSLM